MPREQSPCWCVATVNVVQKSAFCARNRIAKFRGPRCMRSGEPRTANTLPCLSAGFLEHHGYTTEDFVGHAFETKGVKVVVISGFLEICLFTFGSDESLKADLIEFGR